MSTAPRSFVYKVSVPSRKCQLTNSPFTSFLFCVLSLRHCDTETLRHSDTATQRTCDTATLLILAAQQQRLDFRLDDNCADISALPFKPLLSSSSPLPSSLGLPCFSFYRHVLIKLASPSYPAATVPCHLIPPRVLTCLLVLRLSYPTSLA